jgi:hypothetical protein
MEKKIKQAVSTPEPSLFAVAERAGSQENFSLLPVEE